MTYADVKDLKPTDFKRFCGVKPHTFAAMVEALQQREQQKKKKGREAELSLEDQLLLTLQYLRKYRTYFHLSVSWGVSRSHCLSNRQARRECLDQSRLLSLARQEGTARR